MKRVVLLPTYNEAENIEAMIGAIRGLPISPEILVIDDGSPDGTGRLADGIASEDPGVRVLHRTSKDGLGRAYIAGFREVLPAGYERIFQMDCDFSHDPADLLRLDETLEDHDLAIGSRYVEGGRITGWGPHRHLISRFGSFYAGLFLSLPVRDLTGGFKGWRAATLRRIDLEGIGGKGYFFQIEMTFRASRAGARIGEIPITFTDRVKGSSKMSAYIGIEAMIKVPLLRLTSRKPR